MHKFHVAIVMATLFTTLYEISTLQKTLQTMYSIK